MEIKRGDTFAFYANFKDLEGDPIAYDNIACQIRKPNGVLIDELTIAPTATVGRYLFTAGVTDEWPITTPESDIHVIVNGVVISSETFTIEVIKDVS